MPVWWPGRTKRFALLHFLAGALLLFLLAAAARSGMEYWTGSLSGVLLNSDQNHSSHRSAESRSVTPGQPGSKLVAAERLAEKRRSSPPGGLELLASGNHSVTSAELLNAIWMPDHATPTILEETIREQLLSFYQERGYIDCRIDEVAASKSLPWKVRVNVEEGSIYTLTGIEIEGVSAFSAEVVRKMYPEPGEVVNWPKLRRADASLGQRYREAGYLDAKVSTQALKSPSRREFRHRVSVAEGRLYRIRSIRVPTRFLANNPFHKGEPFNPSLLRRFLAESGLSQSNVVVDRLRSDATVEITISDAKPFP